MSLERSLVLNRYLHHQFGAERFEPVKKAVQPCGAKKAIVVPFILCYGMKHYPLQLTERPG